MNSRLYRVIFNKHLGRLVVVSEKTVAQGKAGSQGANSNKVVLADSQLDGSNEVVYYCYSKWVSLTAAVLVSIGVANVAYAEIQTQIIADKGAPKNEQATVLNTANGLAQINIQSPNSQGVSKNTFSQFDIGGHGAIINNSRTNVQTQTAGWVEGNPWLAKGEAKLILNQVNSSNPSQLAGYTEITGSKAELVIANPAGITCSGCGFINAARTTLTTGKPTFNNDTLTGFQIGSGKMTVEGKGLDDSQSDYTQLISQATALNAKVYSKQLDVITGNNTVSYETNPATTKISHNGVNQSTGVALDISSLGGMYAGRIRLIGTDKGMGVTNAGDISSSSTLTLDNQGNLINTGSMNAKQGVNLKHTGSIDNQGTVSSSTDSVKLDSPTLKNSGVISSHGQTDATTQSQITNTGLISAGQVNIKTPSLANQGRIEQTGSGKLDVTSQHLTNQDNAVIGQSLYDKHPATTTPTLATAPSTAQTGSTKQVANSTATTPTTDSHQPVLAPITADGNIQADNLVNQGNNAVITANGAMTVTSPSVTNQRQGSIVVNGLNTQAIDNINSRIQLDKLDWQLTRFNNQQGQIVAKQGISLTAPQINNQQGVLATLGDISLSTSELNNQQGSIQGKQATITATQVYNSQGTIQAEGNLNLDSQGNLTNQNGHIMAQGDASLHATDIKNDKGSVVAGGKLSTTSQTLTNSGQLYGTTGNTLTMGSLTNTATGLIAAQGNTNIHAQTVNNTGILAAGIDTQGNLSTTPANLTMNAVGILTSSGTHIATGKASLQGNPTDLNGSKTQAADIEMASQGDLSTKGASLTAIHQLTLVAKGTLNNQDGTLSGQTLQLTGNQLNNQRGSIRQSGTADLTFNFAGGISNQQGQIATNSQNFIINTPTLKNKAGRIEHAGNGQLSLTANNVNNSDKGNILSLADQTWQIAGDIDNSQGQIQGDGLTVSAHTLINTDGQVVASNTTGTVKANQLNLKGDLNNTGNGVIYSDNGSLVLTAQAVTNSAQLTSRGDLNLNSQILNNRGSISSLANTHINNQTNLSNTATIAQGRLAIQTGELNQAQSSRLVAGLSPDNSLSTTPQHLTITSTGVQHNQGNNVASGGMTVTGSALDYHGSRNQVVNLSLNTLGNIDLSQSQNKVSQQASFTANALNHNAAITQADSYQLKVQSLSNQRGTLEQTGTQDFVLTTGTIDNQQGHLGGNATNLSLMATGDIQNQGGEVIHAGTGTATLIAQNLDNSQTGKLLSNGKLTATVSGTLNNDIGGIQADQLSVTAGSLNNNQGQVIASTGDLTVNAGILANSGEKAVLQSAQALYVNARTLNNDTKAQLLANTTADIHADTLNNTNAGLIYSNQALNIGGDTLNNNATISSQDAITASSQKLTNQASGNIQAGKDINLTQQTLTNQGVISTQTNINSSTQGVMDNHAGQVIGNNVTIAAQSLNNQGGSIQQADKDGQLTLTTTGLLDNQNTQGEGRGILANGKAVLQASDISNQSGLINATDALSLTSTGNEINNQQGVIGSNQQLIITGTSATLNNQSGKLWGDSTTITANGLANTGVGSLISATKNMTLNVNSIDNQNTKQDLTKVSLNQGIVAGNDLVIHAQTLNNIQGQLLANQGIQVAMGQSLTNTNGHIEAKTITTQGSTGNITNAGGVIRANETSLSASSISNGEISGNRLTLNQMVDYTNAKGDKLLANELTITTQGNVNNDGTLSADKQLTVNAKDINNTQTGELVSNASTLLNATGDINNHGLINGNDTLITAGNAVNNLSEGRIYGTHLAIKADTLNNTPGNTLNSAPVIAARERLDIGVKTLNNNPNTARRGKFNSDFNGQAQILSNGELHIGGDLDSENHATGKATTVTNRGATIESLGAMQIATETLNNINADFKTALKVLENNPIVEYSISGDGSNPIYNEKVVEITSEDNNDGRHRLKILKTGELYDNYYGYKYTELLSGQDTVTSDPSRIVSGSNMVFDLGKFNTNKSQIIAGGTIKVNGQAGNVDAEATTITPKYSYENFNGTHYSPYETCRRSIGNWCYKGKWGTNTNSTPLDMAQPLNPKTTGTPYDLKILNINNPVSGVYVTAVTVANQNQANQAQIDTKQVAAVNQAIGNLQTLLTVVKTANNGTQVDRASLARVQDAIKALQDFTKTNPVNLTAEQQKQLADLVVAQQGGQKVDIATLSDLINQLNQSINTQKAQEIRTQGTLSAYPTVLSTKSTPTTPTAI
ncbi:filamentous hemagglutinin N-terminal domain-containing protein [Faucicola mancuniensis]|uniref:two-partner secretion domain-containing protein n=1 Tax=Faucicola mancuniensis TaxID=1309795 RepID=UPI003977641F